MLASRKIYIQINTQWRSFSLFILPFLHLVNTFSSQLLEEKRGIGRNTELTMNPGNLL